MDDFFEDRDPKVQKILVEMRHWDKRQCVEFLKEHILPNHFHEIEMPEIVEVMEQHSEREIKSALIQILQNTDPRKIYKPSSFN